MTILAWCLIGVGCFLLLYGFGILSVSERSDTDIKRAAEKEREDAIQQIFAEYRAKGEKLRQEAIRQGLGPDALPPLEEWPFKPTGEKHEK